MKTGRVKFFSEARGYGFITIDGGKDDVLVRKSDVQDEIKERDRVSFEIFEENNRKKAMNVTLL